jgi:hypothetical protein
MTTRVVPTKASPQRPFAFELRRCGYAARRPSHPRRSRPQTRMVDHWQAKLARSGHPLGNLSPPSLINMTSPGPPYPSPCAHPANNPKLLPVGLGFWAIAPGSAAASGWPGGDCHRPLDKLDRSAQGDSWMRPHGPCPLIPLSAPQRGLLRLVLLNCLLMVLRPILLLCVRHIPGLRYYVVIALLRFTGPR